MCALVFAGCSHVGRRRSENQDRWTADSGLGLFAVADGVASSSDGALAAQMVIELLAGYVGRRLKPDDLGDVDAPARLGRALAELSDDLHAHGRTDPRLSGAATTVVAAVVDESRAVVAYLGDSRAYLMRERRLRALTVDHSLVQALIEVGDVPLAEAGHHPARGMLTRHVAMAPPALPDATRVDLQAGDRILLCSDGLHGVVDEERLAQILSTQIDPDEACEVLIGAANDAGGPDNITAVVINAGVSGKGS